MTYGSLYFGKDGFLYKKNGAVGNRRIFSLGLICNQPTNINNKYVSGSGVNGAVSSNNYAIRRKMIRNSANCVNNSCSINYFYLGYPLSYNNTCSLLLPRVTPYQVCSPFPFWGGLYNNNRRLSPFVGSENGNQKWRKTIFNSSSSYTCPIISKDGTIYITDYTNGYLYAVNKNGTQNWSLNLSSAGVSQFSCSVTIGNNNRIYLSSSESIYAINDYGTYPSKKWETEYIGYPTSNILIGDDGAIYVVTYNNYLISFDPDTGELLNTIQLVLYDQTTIPMSGISIGSDGTIYVVTYYTDDSSNNYSILCAINPDTFVEKWNYRISHGTDSYYSFSNPSISTDGTIYFVTTQFVSGDVTLYAINKNGALKWTTPNTITSTGYTFSSPTIGNNGAIYIGVINSDGATGTLFSINPTTGDTKWSYNIDTPINFSSCLIDSNETLYFSTGTSSSSTGKMFAVTTNTSGNPYTKWSKSLVNSSFTSPTMDSDGIVYTITSDGTLYAFN
jgi:outer membrane protein assembly factor BamB